MRKLHLATVLAVTQLVGLLHVQADPPSTQPSPLPAPDEQRANRAPASDQRPFTRELEPIIPNDMGIAAIMHEPTEDVPIFKGSSEVAQGTSSTRPKFYVYPSAALNRRVLEEAFAKKIRCGLDDPPIYRIQFPLEFITAERRAKAAEQLSRDGAFGKVTADDINLFPYAFLQVWILDAPSAGQKRLADCVPPLAINDDELYLGNLPNSTTVRIFGTEDWLREFVEAPKIQLRSFVKGFSIEQNLATFTSSAFVRHGFSHFLTGEARWQDLQNYTGAAESSVFGLGSLAFVRRDASSNVAHSRSSWVTRRQVMDLVGQCGAIIRDSRWEEFAHTPQPLYDQVTSQLLSRAIRHATVPWDPSISSILDDGSIKQDRSADVINDINESVKQSWGERRQKESASANVLKVASGSVSQESSIGPDESGITWEGKGTAVVPKTVQIYQFNSACFTDLFSVESLKTKARKDFKRVDEMVTLFTPPQPTPPMVEITTWLSDLSPTVNTSGWGNGGANFKNHSIEGNQIALETTQQSYDRGWGCHVSSVLEFQLDGSFQTLKIDAVGNDLEDEGGADKTVQVIGDGRLLWIGHLRNVDKKRAIENIPDIAVSGVHRLQLTGARENNDGQHGHFDWANPRLLKTVPADRAAAEQGKQILGLLQFDAGFETFGPDAGFVDIGLFSGAKDFLLRSGKQ